MTTELVQVQMNLAECLELLDQLREMAPNDTRFPDDYLRLMDQLEEKLARINTLVLH